MTKSPVGENIRTLRIEYGYSQKKLAEMLNSAQNTISNWENGTREPDNKTLIKLSKIFNTTTDYLLGKSNIKNPEKQEFIIPEEFTDPKEARKYVGMHTIFGSNGFNADKMSDEEILQFANEMLKQIDLISYKFKK